MTRFYIEIHCNSVDKHAIVSLFTTIKTIAPYMVDNCEYDLGLIDRHGKRQSINEVSNKAEEVRSEDQVLRGNIEEQE